MTFDEHIAQEARRYLVTTLVACNWNVTRAAQAAGRDRSDFYKLLKKYGVERRSRVPQVHRGNWAAQGL